ncbi:uncharacterized protein MYCFIDRAFT_195143 [Pseudocercospora fijiensis CIRAD86]|uniref:Uncharacterized protein n=1 Tax=Pseudocercospora fijiensis (strain CIRAD86) TaxID=383855 RepID=M3AHA1_PSEFD|nr:uncharacterized protein MYCFIDRAFT_195143 [Pseudocercospora fijiensis CIRAD86]EME83956.1 hypothetical protein MYCFIDRAFT_195143 [Pseudocercospora fijiensis CIRAD86]
MADTDTAVEPPPSYSSLPPSQPSQPLPSSTPSLPERTGTHEYHLQRVAPHSLGLQILHNSTVLYYLASYQAQNTPDLILYAGYDSKGPQLALAKFENSTKNFKTYIGGQKSPAGDDWDTKTRESTLGASRFSPRDYKLVEEGNDGVVAVYLERKFGEGVVKWRVKVSEVAEMQALMVLLGLLEKSRRYMKSVKRAFPNTNGW